MDELADEIQDFAISHAVHLHSLAPGPSSAAPVPSTARHGRSSASSGPSAASPPGSSAASPVPPAASPACNSHVNYVCDQCHRTW